MEVRKADSIIPYSNQYAIPESELHISVTAFLSDNGTQLDVFPTYEWLVPVQPKGKDYFGYSISSSYSAVSGERSNIIWSKLNKDQDWVNSGSAVYTSTTNVGYQNNIYDLIY